MPDMLILIMLIRKGEIAEVLSLVCIFLFHPQYHSRQRPLYLNQSSIFSDLPGPHRDSDECEQPKQATYQRLICVSVMGPLYAIQFFLHGYLFLVYIILSPITSYTTRLRRENNKHTYYIF
jgi:hypothetical protein